VARESVSASVSGPNNPSKQKLVEIDGTQEPAELRTGGNCGSGPLLGY